MSTLNKLFRFMKLSTPVLAFLLLVRAGLAELGFAQSAAPDSVLLEFEARDSSDGLVAANGLLTITNLTDASLQFTTTLFFLPSIWQEAGGETSSISETLSAYASSSHEFGFITTTSPCSWTLPAIVDFNDALNADGTSDQHVFLRGKFTGSLTQTFGCEEFEEALDWGDDPQAPNVSRTAIFPNREYHYPTTRSHYGARHVLLKLGSGVWWTPLYLSFNNLLPDAEDDGLPALLAGKQAGGDDHHGMDDEDGVRIEAANSEADPVACTENRVRISPRGIPGYLNAWADYDQDGRFAISAPEHFIINRPQDPFPERILPFDMPCLDAYTYWVNTDPQPSDKTELYFRFRYSTESNLSPMDEAPDGEVEDHERNVTVPPGSCPSKKMSDNVVLMLEGYKGFANNDPGTCTELYGKLRSEFVEWGWSEDKVKLVGIYHDTSGCEYNLGDYPTWSTNDNITKSTPIGELAWRLAWLIYEEFSGKCTLCSSCADDDLECLQSCSSSCPTDWNESGTFQNPGHPEVDIVAHSMGGLVVQYAILRSNTRDSQNLEWAARMGDATSEFPVLRGIHDVVTAGTPHGGLLLPAANPINILDDFVCDPGGFAVPSRQCQDLMVTSSFFRDLIANGSKFNPPTSQNSAAGNTEWTRIFSLFDLLIALGGSGDSEHSPWFKAHYTAIYHRGDHRIHHTAGTDGEPTDEVYHDNGEDESGDDMYFKDMSNCGDHDMAWQGGRHTGGGGSAIKEEDENGDTVHRYPHVNWRINLGCSTSAW